MFHYPQLSQSEQASLPTLKALPVALPIQFSDSTHQLWHCDTVDGAMVLKVCNQATVAASSFWRGLNSLFGADFPNSLGQAKAIHAYLVDKGALALPDVLFAQSNRFVLTRYLAGRDFDAAEASDVDVVQLAEHVSRLHQQTFIHFGQLLTPTVEANAWGQRLKNTLQLLTEAGQLTVPDAILQNCLQMAETLAETDFVPIMPDLRWDQFRVLADTNKLALIDLDAFVIGPRALELVLLEYALTPAQFLRFKQAYCQQHDWPDYTAQKPCYQLLLFLMHILGESDCEAWMRRI